MRECPWCGHQNLNVYAYCQRCGRGFEPPENPVKDDKDEKSGGRWFWPFGGKKAA